MLYCKSQVKLNQVFNQINSSLKKLTNSSKFYLNKVETGGKGVVINNLMLAFPNVFPSAETFHPSQG